MKQVCVQDSEQTDAWHRAAGADSHIQHWHKPRALLRATSSRAAESPWRPTETPHHMTSAPATHTVYLRMRDHVEVKGDTSQSTALISTTENNTYAQSTSADEYK